MPKGRFQSFDIEKMSKKKSILALEAISISLFFSLLYIPSISKSASSTHNKDTKVVVTSYLRLRNEFNLCSTKN